MGSFLQRKSAQRCRFIYLKGYNSTTSIRLPEEVLRALDDLASATARNRNYLITEVVKGYVSRGTRHLQRIQEGMREVDAGEVASDQQMEEFWAGWVTPEAPAEA